MDRGEQVAGLTRLALRPPELGQARSRAQLPTLGRLLGRDPYCFEEARLGRVASGRSDASRISPLIRQSSASCPLSSVRSALSNASLMAQ